MSYCTYCNLSSTHEVHRKYHDEEYGFPIADDNKLFGRLILEINQAGLSWETILKKEHHFRNAYAEYDIEKVASFNELDVQRLLSDAGIIRNKLKVHAAIYNANKILELKQKFTTFKEWLDFHHPLTKEEWTKLFRKEFKFVGGEIVNEFLMSSGYLSGAHDVDCPIFKLILKENPKWKEKR